jgi:hypothetical protein
MPSVILLWIVGQPIVSLFLMPFMHACRKDTAVSPALWKTNFEAYTNGNPPEDTIDGDLSTRWSAFGDGQWIEYDLGSTKNVGLVKIAWLYGDRRMAYFDIEVSTDGVDWSQVYSGQSSGTTVNLESYDFDDVTARYVRIVGHRNTRNGWNSITEVEIYGR